MARILPLHCCENAEPLGNLKKAPARHHWLALQEIDLSTFRGLLERDHEVACYFPGCRRWATCDLSLLVRNGLGERRITECRPACRKCGARGEWQVRPPVPTYEGATCLQ